MLLLLVDIFIVNYILLNFFIGFYRILKILFFNRFFSFLEFNAQSDKTLLKRFGSGALHVKMMDLGSLKIRRCGFFFCFKALFVGHYPDPFPIPAGQS